MTPQRALGRLPPPVVEFGRVLLAEDEVTSWTVSGTYDLGPEHLDTWKLTVSHMISQRASHVTLANRRMQPVYANHC